MGFVQRIRRLMLKLRGRDPDFIAVVLFLRNPISVTKELLEQAVNRAWPTNPEEKKENKFVVMKPPIIFVKSNGHLFNIVGQSSPYIQAPEEFARHFADLRVKGAILDHKAWLSVDYIVSSKPVEPNIDRQYAQAAKLAAELVNEDCLGVCLPGENVTVASSPDLADGLRNFQSVKKFSEVYRPAPMIDLTNDFEQNAKAEARSRLAEFVAAFESRKPGDLFLAKRRFEDGDHTEWMWVNLHTREGDRYFGVLENDPLWIKQIVRGAGVQVDSQQIEDWFYSTGGKPVGGFSMPKDSKALKK